MTSIVLLYECPIHQYVLASVPRLKHYRNRHRATRKRTNRVPDRFMCVPTVPTQCPQRLETTMNISLTKFCKDYNLPKSSVYRRCQELSISTSEGLTPDDADRLLIEFDVVTTEPEPEARSVAVEIGNHQVVLANPQLPQTFSLEGLRSSEVVSIEDPLVLAAQFLQVADNITTAMQNDLQQREQKLDDTRKAKDQIATKAQELKLESRLYRMQTDTLDKAVSQETAALQGALASLNNLGKSEAVS